MLKYSNKKNKGGDAMRITTISTGSKGNCYVVESNNQYIILDVGLPFEQITGNPAFPKFSKINFVFVSHC